MNKFAVDRMDLMIPLFGVLFTGIAAYFYGLDGAQGAALGAVLASLNFFVLRWIVRRVVGGELHRKAGLIAMLFLKMGAFMGIIASVLLFHWVQPVPFTLGASSVVAGLLVASVSAVFSFNTLGSER